MLLTFHWIIGDRWNVTVEVKSDCELLRAAIETKTIAGTNKEGAQLHQRLHFARVIDLGYDTATMGFPGKCETEISTLPTRGDSIP